MGGPGITDDLLQCSRPILIYDHESIWQATAEIVELLHLSVPEPDGTDNLILLRKALKGMQKALFDQEIGADRQLGEEIVARMAAIGETERRVDRYVARLRDGRTPDTLDERLLLEAGVAADIIARCRRPGKQYQYVEIREAKEARDAGRDT